MLSAKKIMNIFDVAYYLLKKAEDSQYALSVKSLQTMLYDLQALHLVNLNEPLFLEDFQAWVFGPVNRDLYDLLPEPRDIHGHLTADTVAPFRSSDCLDKADRNFIEGQLDMVWTSPSVSNSHRDTLRRHLPWKEARRGFDPAERCENIISKEHMKIFYSLLWKMQNDLFAAGFLEYYSG